ncbi:MAG: helix-turn-helix domain-containing protein, partial [Candidatus Aenigmatarchaeota archaeon]
YEAKAYYALLLSGHSKAREISKISGVPQSKIYEVLERLLERNLIEVYTIRPKEFKAISPAIILKNFVEEEERKIKETKEKVEELLSSLNSINTEVFDGIWASTEKGWKTFMDKVCEMFGRSERYVFVMSKYFSWSSKLANMVKFCIRKRIKIRTIALREIDETNFFRAKWFSENGVEIRMLKEEKYPSLIDIDGKEILLRFERSLNRKNFPFTSLWSKDESFVKIIDSYLKYAWKISKPVNLEKLENRIQTLSKGISENTTEN